MRIGEKDGTKERLVLTGMVTDDRVLARVASRWDGENFAADWLNVVGGWCVNYYRKHNEAPRGHVRGLFASWAERRKDDGLTRAVADFLTSLSDDYEREESGNPDYLVDQASELFRTVKLARLRDEISGCLDAGRLDDGEQVALSFTRMQMGQGSRINVFNDEAEIRETFAHDDVADLVTFHGALGEFFKGQLVPDSLIGFNGPEKSGKTWWVMELGYQALRNRKRVAFFEVGDMSTRQIKKRLLCRASRHPTRSTNRDGSWPCSVRKPVKLARSPDGKPPYHVEFGEEVVFDAPLSADLALARSRKLLKTDVRAKDSYFCLSVHPCASISVLGIKDQLKQWADEDGWVPQVVVIDYADILAPIDPKKDVWYAIDQTWGKLRALSQELHCCVVTATQADAASYDVETQSRKNFGHCKAKLAHATAFAGINVTGPEKEVGLCRLNWLVAREGPFSNKTCVHVAGCLPLANVAVRSLW